MTKGNKNSATATVDALCTVIKGLQSKAKVRRFLEDLCTPKELEALAERWRVAKLIDKGMPYREIYEKTGVSTATVTRVARAMEHGSGGYRLLLDEEQK
ncbi:MAG: trp operon repressor [Kofleriaceae bacterium]|nr:trp operon repressor [Kofleriaceae bacterium]